MPVINLRQAQLAREYFKAAFYPYFIAHINLLYLLTSCIYKKSFLSIYITVQFQKDYKHSST